MPFDQSRGLYFAAIIPPEDISMEVHEFRLRIAEKYNSRAALKPPVHITLFPPLEMPVSLERPFMSLLDDVGSRHHSFELHLNGFGSFPPRVIYVKPEKELRMNVLSREIVDNFIHHISPMMELRGYKFRAHMTIAYRDLDPSIFPAAWNEFKDKEYKRSFFVGDVSLLKHDRTQWNIIHRSKLLPSKNEDTEDTLDLFT